MIVENSNHDRQKGFNWYESLRTLQITIFGVGGIGSWTSLALSKMGANLTMIDPDLIESQNVGGQFYKPKEIGKLKVESLKDNIYEFSKLNHISTIAQRIDTNYNNAIPFSKYNIMALDNMESRKYISEKWNEFNTKLFEKSQIETYLIDGRMLGEVYEIYFITKDNYETYQKTLFKDSEAASTSCTREQTTYSAIGIGEKIAQIIVNNIRNVLEEDDFYTVPFKFRWEGYNLKLKMQTVEEYEQERIPNETSE